MGVSHEKEKCVDLLSGLVLSQKLHQQSVGFASISDELSAIVEAFAGDADHLFGVVVEGDDVAR